jgi:hypothetical protein
MREKHVYDLVLPASQKYRSPQRRVSVNVSTSAMSGPQPVARQVRTQLACRGSAVRSIAWFGITYVTFGRLKPTDSRLTSLITLRSVLRSASW